MRKAIPVVVSAVVLVAAVVVLRETSSPPEAGPTATTGAQGTPSAVARVAARVDWRVVVVPPEVEQARSASADARRAVFPVLGADGVRRLVVDGGRVVATGVNGGALTGVVGGTSVVVRDQDPAGVSRLFAVDLVTGAERVLAERIRVGALAAVDGLVVAQEGQECLAVFRPGGAEAHCPRAGWAVSLLTAGPGEVQWRETAPGQACAVWYRLGTTGGPERLATGERACRAASLVRVDGWELTADVPPYELGAAYPGPLVARRGDRELPLDATALDVQVCGRAVYWLSRPRYPDQVGELVRWRPGEDRVEVLDGAGRSWPPRCVNGVLNAAVPGPPAALSVLADP